MSGAERHEGTFTGVAGGEIHWRSWTAPDAKGRVVIVHGYGEHGDRYERFAAALNEAGFDVWANDHRGHGRSEGPRGILARMDEAVADVAAMVERAGNEGGEIPTFLFAHSMGGAIGLEYALANQDRLAGLVLSSAAVSLEGFGVSGFRIGLVRALGKIAPGLPVNKLPLEGISRDPEEERIYREDPLVHKGAQPARTVGELLAAMDRLPEEAKDLRIPLLVIAGSADPIVPPAGSRVIAERAGSEDKRVIVYDGFVHELINEPREDRERVTGDVIEWMLARA